MQLLQGRAINTRPKTWVVPDLNDRDAEGNILVREIRIHDFNPRTELEKLPLVLDSETKKRDMLNDLKDGKRISVGLKVNGKIKTIDLELNPLRRGFNFFEGNRKISLNKLLGKAQLEKQAVSIRGRQTISKAKG